MREDSYLCMLCKHAKGHHGPNEWNSRVMDCIVCMNSIAIFGNGPNPFHTFKLDNLDYIEQIAKEKNLI